MNKILFSACVIMVIFLSSCNSEQPEYDSSLPTFPASSTSPAISPGTSNTLLTDTANSTPVTITPQSLPSKNIAALNPKHGEPGHRCDIAVGAPLNSPAQPAPQVVVPGKNLPAQPAVLPGAGGTVRLNPPHGQPGHDCAIQVGKPLKG